MRFEKYVFVCLNEREEGHPRGSCMRRGSQEVFELLKAGVKERGLNSKIRINRAGCMECCELGVTVMVHPDSTWYGGVKKEDVDEIIDRHLLEGKEIERLKMDFSVYKKSNPS